MDQVPASAWFTPRLGFKNISPEDLVKGPDEKGPPQAPLTIVKAKDKGNSPGFIVKDSRGLKYLIKFDRLAYPNLESTVDFVCNRVFWGFGYNVPEDFIYYLNPDETKIGEGVDAEKVEKVYTFSHQGADKRYRTVASLFLKGNILGPINPKGTRRGDINDRIAHENRRVLRALRMFSAYLGNSGLRSDNSLDVYEGEAGQGHTVHYLLDFGENFGSHGLEKDRHWDGFEHFFSLEDSFWKFLALGIPVQKWEKLKFDTEYQMGSFNIEDYEPGKWKETTPYLPIRYSKPDDDYWAAKILTALTTEHLQALFNAEPHPSQEYVQRVLEILKGRREKTIRYAFERVSPLESEGVKAGKLPVEDLGAEFGLQSSEYRVKFLNSKGKRVAPEMTIPGSKTFEVPVEQALAAANGYLRVDVTAVRGGKPAPSAAQFHIRQSENGARLAGVVH